MSLLQTIAIWLSSTLVLIGLASLIATWLMPSVLERPLLRWLITGRRMAPSRYNRTLISVWAIAIGCYILLSVLGYRTASFIAFVIWVPLAIMVLSRLRRAAYFRSLASKGIAYGCQFDHCSFSGRRGCFIWRCYDNSDHRCLQSASEPEITFSTATTPSFVGLHGNVKQN